MTITLGLIEVRSCSAPADEEAAVGTAPTCGGEQVTEKVYSSFAAHPTTTPFMMALPSLYASVIAAAVRGGGTDRGTDKVRVAGIGRPGGCRRGPGVGVKGVQGIYIHS